MSADLIDFRGKITKEAALEAAPQPASAELLPFTGTE